MFFKFLLSESLEQKSQDKAPEFVVKLQDKSAELKEKVTLECKVTGVPVPSIQWFKGDQLLSPSADIKVQSQPDGTQTLIIESIQVDSEGTYKCVAENNAGKAETKATVGVKSKLLLRFPSFFVFVRITRTSFYFYRFSSCLSAHFSRSSILH